MKKNYVPYLTPEANELIEESNSELTKAIRVNEPEQWRLSKSIRNQAHRFIEKIKGEYLTCVLNNSRKLWKSIQVVTNDDNATLPRRINFEGRTINSSKEIANICMKYFINKIESIRNRFKNSELDPLMFLRFLIPEADQELKIPEITPDDTLKIIKTMKCTNTTGNDSISSRILKMIPDHAAIYITHAINISIREGRFPQILKIARILPLSKKDKPKNSLEGYRPISNLHTIDKIYEEWMKKHILKHLKTNKIITEEHHGGLENHSTMTAKAVLDFYSTKAVDSDDQGVLLSTDLSAAYDTVDHVILLNKLHYYGFRGKEYQLIKSYLEKRMAYVQIDISKSKIMEFGPYGVIQGSKLSGILYSLYTNEVPKLHKVLYNHRLMEFLMDRRAYNQNEIEHNVAQFVDDSNSIIIFKNRKDVKAYLNSYFILLKIFYNLNKLKINDDKTNLMFLNNPRHDDEMKEVKIVTDTDTIKPKEKFTILGWIVNKRMDYSDHLNSVSSKVHHRMHRAKEVTKYMSAHTRVVFSNAYLYSVLNYGAPLMFGTTTKINLKMHKIYMAISRYARGNYGYKQSCHAICKGVGKKVSHEEFYDHCAKFVQKLIYTKEPKSILDQLRMPRSRQNAKIGLKVCPRNKKFKSTFINKIPEVYSSIPDNLRGVKPRLFKKKIKKTRIKAS